MVRAIRLAASAAVLVVGLATPSAASPADVVIDVGPKAQLVDGGLGVVLQVRTRCPTGHEQLEGFAYVTQDGNQSQFRGVSTTCDGRWHQAEVTVPANEGSPFHPGTAVGTGFLLVLDESGATHQDGDSQRVRLS